MSSRRTKTLFWLSAFPPVFGVAAAAWVVFYSFYLQHAGKATYFVVLHVHWIRLLAVSAAFLLCGAISLSFDRRKVEKK